MALDDGDTYGRTIQLFLADGVPNGLIIASIHGWTGSVLVAKQSAFSRLLARPEVDRTGVYILFGPDPDDSLSMRTYIGEADNIRKRIDTSAAKRAFWETAIAITTSDEALTKGHVRYLEARLIALAQTAGRTKLDNDQLPDALRRFLPEADVANMERFLADLRVILPVVGFELLKPRPTALAKVTTGQVPIVAGATKFEIRHKSGVKAFAVEEDGEFVVLEGSEALKDMDYASNSYATLKRELIDSGILRVSEDNARYVFARPYAFRSPSAAGATVLDRNTNGRTRWHVVGGDLTYHEWQEAKANAAIASS